MYRQVVPLPMGKYKDSEKIKFLYDTPQEVISTHQVEMNTYAAKLLNAL